MRILLIGDIFGEYGRKALEDNLPKLIQEYGINFIVANGENIAHGKGITFKYYQWLLEQHVNVVTLGNHSFSNRTIIEHMEEAKNLVRPLNYGEGTPGKGYVTINYNGKKITVFQVMGSTFENHSSDCLF
jgi:calcineurin-like phosphoesterase